MVYAKYWKALGISETNDKAEIKKAYLHLAKKYHPDINKSPDAKAKFQEIQEAYDVLYHGKRVDPGYHGAGTTNEHADNFFNFFFDQEGGEFFNIFTQQGGREEDNLSNLHISVILNVNLEDIFLEKTKTFSYTAYGTCMHCDGTKDLSKTTIKCPQCMGQGHIRSFLSIRVCNTCYGTGRIIKQKCNHCDKKGQVKIVKTQKDFQLHRYMGVGDTTYRLDGGGSSFQKRSGHLFIKLHVHIPEGYQLDAHHLKYKYHISIFDLLLGTTFTFNHFGRTINVTVPKYSNHTLALHISREGLQHPKSRVLGDLVMVFEPKFPKKLSHEQESILNQYFK